MMFGVNNTMKDSIIRWESDAPGVNPESVPFHLLQSERGNEGSQADAEKLTTQPMQQDAVKFFCFSACSGDKIS
jgi:hypothetical protein